nr:phosphopantothenoylcysteine decarboxylase [Fimbriimonadaceae bacterium]
ESYWNTKVLYIDGENKRVLVRRLKPCSPNFTDATNEKYISYDYIIGCAAVSDYRPIEKLKGKIRRSAEHMRLDLVANPDVLAHLAANAPNAKVIAFAAEPSGDLEEAWAKKQRKGAFALAMNDISRRDIGFETDENDLTLLFADQKVERSGKRSKLACALWLLNHVV